jgi:aryl-alcohol dehydrogenase-like predicted oxidoreductase
MRRSEANRNAADDPRRVKDANVLSCTVNELGIGVTAYGALSRGLLSGSQPAAQGDLRARLPRFAGLNRQSNQSIIDTLQKLAAAKRVRPSQLAIAWVLAKRKDIVPVIGARRRTQLVEALRKGKGNRVSHNSLGLHYAAKTRPTCQPNV